MDGGAYGGGKAGAPFDPIAFVQRPQVILRALCLVSRRSPESGIVSGQFRERDCDDDDVVGVRERERERRRASERASEISRRGWSLILKESLDSPTTATTMGFY